MADTVPQESRFNFPFSREEYLRALRQVKPREEAEAQANGLYRGEPPDVIGVHVMDGDLLLLAALSEAMAARVLAFRPGLADLVRRVRADPERFLQSWRDDTRGE